MGLVKQLLDVALFLIKFKNLRDLSPLTMLKLVLFKELKGY